jgi:putative pyruvate formate lyase activating enzyme
MVISANELAAIIWVLRMEGCHNINFVGGDPTIHLHTIIRSLQQLSLDGPPIETIRRVQKIKSDQFMNYRLNSVEADYFGEFNAPMLWNSNFFMSEETMRILRTVIDVWLPDFKFGPNKKCATTLSRTPWYFTTVARNHKLIYDWGEDFTIRHLIMPNHIDCCSKPILDWVAGEIPGSLINIMDQYHPDSFTDPYNPNYNPRYKSISRRLTKNEISTVIDYAKHLKLDFDICTFY